MKRWYMGLVVICLLNTTTVVAAMSSSRVRLETRFLTDKMAYELGLTTLQYNDVYEINYDFLASIRGSLDDAMYGDSWALDQYYEALDIRNDDLRFVLSSTQYRRFIGLEYFARPVSVDNGRWGLRVYLVYTNRNHFYWPRPYHYRTYCGTHHRRHYDHVSYYRGRHHHQPYGTVYRIRGNQTYSNYCESDFGRTPIRTNGASHRYPSSNSRYPSSNSRYPSSDRRSPIRTGGSTERVYHGGHRTGVSTESRGRTESNWSGSRTGVSSSRTDSEQRSSSETRTETNSSPRTSVRGTSSR